MKPNTYHAKKRNGLLIAVVLLFMLVFVSGIFLGMQISKYTKQESVTEITLQQNAPHEQGEQAAAQQQEAPSIPSEEKENVQPEIQPTQKEESKNDTATQEEQSQETVFVPKPGFAVDGGAVGAEVVLFRAAYDGEGGMTVVQSASDEKVVAPGTTQSHKVRLRNTGNSALRYTLHIRDLFPDVAEDRVVPIELRVTDYNGAYVLGDANTWVPLADMDREIHSGIVGRDSYVYYTLQWRWAFEAERDDYDTMLGNVTDEIVSCGVQVQTYAEAHTNPDAIGGISNPFTGDTAKLGLWTAMAILSAFGIFLLVVLYRREKQGEEAL